jgi:hypothetical protein
MSSHIVSFASAILGLVGSIILAFSLNRLLSEVNFAINAMSVSIESMASSGNIYVFGGMDEILDRAKGTSSSWVRSGIYFLVSSTLLASWNLFFN